MTDTRRFFMKRAIETAGGLIVAAGFPLRASADCASDTKILGFGVTASNGIVTRHCDIPDWRLGNCELRSGEIDIVRMQVLNQPPAPQQGTLSAQVCTHFTHTKDVWHLRLQLVSVHPVATSPAVFFDQTFDGPQMSELDNPLFHQWTTHFSVDPAIDVEYVYARITSCC